MVQKLIATCLFILFISSQSHANIIFEGYYKILVGDTHVGFAIQKYAFNSKTQQFEAFSYTRTNPVAGDLTESLKAFADKKLTPVSYNLVTTTGNVAKVIDASFKKTLMTGTIKTAEGLKKINVVITPEVILSAFLPIVMLNSPVGIKTKTNYTYKAIVEANAEVASGLAIVLDATKYLGEDAFKVDNTFQGIRFVSFMNGKGEVLGTNSPTQNLTTELVGSPQVAIGNIPYNANHLKLTFGENPKGVTNSMANRLIKPAKPVIQKPVVEVAPTSRAPQPIVESPPLENLPPTKAATTPTPAEHLEPPEPTAAHGKPEGQ